jgi:hypothetical protein
MVPCPSCHRHVRDAEPSCPFCAAALPSFSSPVSPVAGKAIKVAAVLLTPLVLAACYGPPRGQPPEPPSPSGKTPAPDNAKPPATPGATGSGAGKP